MTELVVYFIVLEFVGNRFNTSEIFKFAIDSYLIQSTNSCKRDHFYWITLMPSFCTSLCVLGVCVLTLTCMDVKLLLFANIPSFPLYWWQREEGFARSTHQIFIVWLIHNSCNLAEDVQSCSVILDIVESSLAAENQ